MAKRVWFSYSTGEIVEAEEQPGEEWAPIESLPRAIAALARRQAVVIEEMKEAFNQVTKAIEVDRRDLVKMVQRINRNFKQIERRMT